MTGIQTTASGTFQAVAGFTLPSACQPQPFAPVACPAMAGFAYQMPAEAMYRFAFQRAQETVRDARLLAWRRRYLIAHPN